MSSRIVPLIDEQVIDQLTHDTGSAVLPVLVAAFVEEIHELMPRLADAVDTDNYDAVSRDIHSLKSSSGTFGAALLLELSRSMDDAHKAGDDEHALALGMDLHVRIRETISAYRARFELEA